MNNQILGVKANKKFYGYCGIIRKRDFEDDHPVIAGVMALIAMVTAVAIAMVIF